MYFTLFPTISWGRLPGVVFRQTSAPRKATVTTQPPLLRLLPYNHHTSRNHIQPHTTTCNHMQKLSEHDMHIAFIYQLNIIHLLCNMINSYICQQNIAMWCHFAARKCVLYIYMSTWHAADRRRVDQPTAQPLNFRLRVSVTLEFKPKANKPSCDRQVSTHHQYRVEASCRTPWVNCPVCEWCPPGGSWGPWFDWQGRRGGPGGRGCILVDRRWRRSGEEEEEHMNTWFLNILKIALIIKNQIVYTTSILFKTIRSLVFPQSAWGSIASALTLLLRVKG